MVASNVPLEEQGTGRTVCVLMLRLLFLVFLVGILAALAVYTPKKPHYYAAIAAVSGLDPATEDRVDFTLTLGVASANPLSSECFEPGTSVVVTYLGVQLAHGSTAGQVCAARWKPEHTVQTTVVARGTGARLPESVLDSLAADVRRGVAAFDFALQIPSTGGDDRKLVSCRGRRVGDDRALSMPCDVLKTTS